jgi:hypothetical protein
MRNDIIFVVNNNDFTHQDRFDGIDYFFPSKEKVQLPVEAAEHMFGFGKPDKTETLVRMGWATWFNPTTKRTEEDPEGVKKLAKFVFTQAVMVEAQVDSPADLSGGASDESLEIA